MKKAPYSLSEAKAICAEYQYLSGQPFGKDTNALVDGIVITPFEPNSKERFFAFFMLFGDADMALAAESHSMMLYDVAVVAGAGSMDFWHTDIHAWLAENKFAFRSAEEPLYLRVS